MEDKKIVLVTGASRGIGLAIAKLLAEQSNYFVIGTATSKQGAEEITNVFKKNKLSGIGLPLDFSINNSIENLVNVINEEYGPIQVLVNNAAITQDNLLLRMKGDEWDKVILVNLTSVFRLTKLCIKDMIKSRWGRVVNISSVVALMGNPGQCNYGAAKAGIIGFSKSLAHEVASRAITVNIVAPGFIDTDMTKILSDEQKEHILSSVPMKRLGKPDEIAQAVRFLISNDASYITGSILNVNGGMYMY